MNPKKVIVRGPALSQSGYGEHTRFVLRTLRSRPDLFEVFLINVNWGQTGWIWDNTPERTWIDSLLLKTIHFTEQKGEFDLSVQVQIPNEWTKLAPVNIGVTAGIETTKISSEWVQGTQNVDKIIVVSEHAKYGFDNTIYEGIHNITNERVTIKTTCPIEVVGYPVKEIEPCEDFNFNLKHDFNFLFVGTWIVRKNIEKTVTWLLDEFHDKEVGIILKTSLVRNCQEDRYHTQRKLKPLLDKYKDRKCEVYLLHGDLNETEMTALYQHPKVKALVSLTHGEGFGLPLFEAAYNGLPVVAPNWSGHCDFLYMPLKDKRGKSKKTAMFTGVAYDIKPIQREAHWSGILQADSMWCFPKEWSAKKAFREVYKNHGGAKSKAKKLQKYIKEAFSQDKQYNKLVKSILPESGDIQLDYVYVADAFIEQYVGGAELSLETLIDSSPGRNLKLNSNVIDKNVIELYRDKKWIFGNFFTLSKDIVKYIAESNIEYYVIDSDYHFCEHRLKELCMMYNAQDDCYCVEKTEHGKTIQSFLKSAKMVFYRSEKQRDYHREKVGLSLNKTKILSSNFSNYHLDIIKSLREGYKDKKENYWVVSSSPSWVKGALAAKAWCDKNNKKYVELHGKNYMETLEILAKAEGFCCLPAGADTCPRMVIEAKLLGCKLQLNEHVLHADEKWFNTDNLETVEKHLKKLTNYFWKSIKTKNSNATGTGAVSEHAFQDRRHNVQR